MRSCQWFILPCVCLWLGACSGAPVWHSPEADLDRVAGEALVNDCEGGSGSACIAVADRLEALTERSEAQDVALYELYVEACALGEPEGCQRLGSGYVYGPRENRAPQRAHWILVNACDRGDSYACYIAGFTLVEGGLGEADEAGALPLLNKGCDLDHANCCGQVGLMHEFGVGTPLDRGAAYPYFEKACQLGEAQVGCFNAAMHLSERPDEELDVPRVIELFQRSCDAGNQLGCDNVQIIQSWEIP